MSFEGGAIHQNIIEENDDKVAKMLPEYAIHGGLKGAWCIAEPKWHYFKFVMSMVGSESSLRYVRGMHADLVISLE